MCRQAEARKQTKYVVRGASASAVNYVKRPNPANSRRNRNPNVQSTPSASSSVPRSGAGRFNRTNQKFNPHSNSQSKLCQWCGKEVHDRRICPARSVNCNKCGTPGHYGIVCRQTENVHEIGLELESDDQHLGLQDEYDDIDVPFLGEIGGSIADDEEY